MTSFVCPNCEEGTVEDRAIAGRMTTVMPGVMVELPADLVLPSCDQCLDYSVPEYKEDEVTRALALGLQKWQPRVIQNWINYLLVSVPSVTLRKIAASLDMPWPQLLRISNGQEDASLSTLRLLRLYVRHADEFQHVLKAKSLEEPTEQTSALGEERIDPSDSLEIQRLKTKVNELRTELLECGNNSGAQAKLQRAQALLAAPDVAMETIEGSEIRIIRAVSVALLHKALSD